MPKSYTSHNVKLEKMLNGYTIKLDYGAITESLLISHQELSDLENCIKEMRGENYQTARLKALDSGLKDLSEWTKGKNIPTAVKDKLREKINKLLEI